VISKKNHTLGYGFKNPPKIYSLAYGFLLFVSKEERRDGKKRSGWLWRNREIKSQKGAGEKDQKGDAQQDGEANHSITTIGADEIEARVED
jgi:hypothetical protein